LSAKLDVDADSANEVVGVVADGLDAREKNEILVRFVV